MPSYHYGLQNRDGLPGPMHALAAEYCRILRGGGCHAAPLLECSQGIAFNGGVSALLDPRMRVSMSGCLPTGSALFVAETCCPDYRRPASATARLRGVVATNVVGGLVNVVAADDGVALAASCVEDHRAYNRQGELVSLGRSSSGGWLATVLDGHFHHGGLRRTAADVVALGDGFFASAGFDGHVATWRSVDGAAVFCDRENLSRIAAAVCVHGDGGIIAAGLTSGALHVLCAYNSERHLEALAGRVNLAPPPSATGRPSWIGSVDAVRVSGHAVYGMVGAMGVSTGGSIFRVALGESSMCCPETLFQSHTHGLTAMDHHASAHFGEVLVVGNGSVADDVSAGDGIIKAVDPRCRSSAALPVGLPDVEALRISPCGTLVAAVDATLQRAVVCDMRFAGERARPVLVHELGTPNRAVDPSAALAWLPDGCLAVGGSAGTVAVLDPSCMQLPRSAAVGPPISAIAADPLAVYVGTSGSSLHVLSTLPLDGSLSVTYI